MPLSKTNTLEDFNEHILAIALQTGTFTLEPGLLQQLIREVAIGVCTHQTMPSVELDVGIDGIQPILPPAYRYTKTGELLAKLAYSMQGYLYGGMIDPLSDSSKPMSIKRYFFEHYPEVEYQSYIAKLGQQSATGKQLLIRAEHEMPTEEDYEAIRFSGSRLVFTLAFTQQDTLAFDHTLLMTPLLNVNASVKRTPQYERVYQNYLKMHGTAPEGDIALSGIGYAITKDVQTYFPKLMPDLIATLQVVHAIAVYFKCLKDVHRMADLTPCEEVYSSKLPKTLPYLYTPSYCVSLSVKQLAEYLARNFPWKDMCTKDPDDYTKDLKAKLRTKIGELLSEQYQIKSGKKAQKDCL